MKKTMPKILGMMIALVLMLAALVSCATETVAGPQGEAGKDGAAGKNGKSAYDLAVENGYVGTVEQWLKSLVGAQGEKGDKGETGEKGDTGAAGEKGDKGAAGVNGWNGKNGKDGADGKDGLGIKDVDVSCVLESDGAKYMIFVITYTDGTTEEIKVLQPNEVVNVESANGDKEAAGVALKNAISEAKPGDTIVLAEDTSVPGYRDNLTIDKAITIDLNGKELTTGGGWGGIVAKGGCTIKNGTINHTGNTAAIKAFQVEAIENVTINVTQTENKIKGGIVVQEGAGCYVGSIKNVTINGATNGIETYRCGSRTDLAIGSMENVTINATDCGMLLSAPIGTVKNCTVKGDNIGINAYLYGPYSVSIDLVGCRVTGMTAIYAHDEVAKTNPGTLTVTYDEDTVITGVITEEFEEEVKERVNVSLK